MREIFIICTINKLMKHTHTHFEERKNYYEDFAFDFFSPFSSSSSSFNDYIFIYTLISFLSPSRRRRRLRRRCHSHI